MVWNAVPVLGGRVTSHLAAPMLRGAIEEFERGNTLGCAAKLREALRRHLCTLAELHAVMPTSRPTPKRLIRALRRAGVQHCDCYLVELLEACDKILAMEHPETCLRFCLELAGDYIRPEFDARNGGEL